MHILVYPILKIAFLKVGIYTYYTVFFHFRPYNMSWTALDMYQLILKHHGTVPLYGKCSNSKLMSILAYTIYFWHKLVYTRIYKYMKYKKSYTCIYLYIQE